MKQINLQFHARKEEIYEFVNDILREQSYIVYGVIISPYRAERVFADSDISNFQEYDIITVSKEEPLSYENYHEFIDKQKNNLVIMMGVDNGEKLIESSMGVLAENEIDNDWKKLINKYKRGLLKGAWVVNRNTSGREYYKNHRYTVGAKEAYDRGILICAFAGCCTYELASE